MSNKSSKIERVSIVEDNILYEEIYEQEYRWDNVQGNIPTINRKLLGVVFIGEIIDKKED